MLYRSILLIAFDDWVLFCAILFNNTIILYRVKMRLLPIQTIHDLFVRILNFTWKLFSIENRVCDDCTRIFFRTAFCRYITCFRD